MTYARLALGLLWLTLGAGSGCRQVIGIEEANVDPTLGQATDPTSEEDSGVDPGSAGTAAETSAPVAGTSSTDAGTGGGAGVGVGGGAGAGAEGGGGANLFTGTLCERYCGAVTQNCTGAFAVYANYANCLDVCAILPEGMPGETEHNTVNCRFTSALFAPTEVSYYCPAAGPGGNGVCGSDCEGFCRLLVGVCSPYSEVELKYDECKKTCNELEDLGTYTVDPAAELYEGDHVQCRLYHVSAAASADTEAHCQHAFGNSPCN